MKYAFIGITDRFEESMLVLAHLLGLNIEDMLYLKAKDSHSLKTDNKGYHYLPTVPVDEQSGAVREYLSGEWKQQNYGDYKLYKIAIKVLKNPIFIASIVGVSVYGLYKLIKK